MTRSAYLIERNQGYASWDETIFRYTTIDPNCLRLSNRNMSDAEDLVQTAFYRILESRPNVAALKQPLGYLRVALCNTWKKKNCHVEVGLEEVDHSDPSVIMMPDIQDILES